MPPFAPIFPQRSQIYLIKIDLVRTRAFGSLLILCVYMLNEKPWKRIMPPGFFMHLPTYYKSISSMRFGYPRHAALVPRGI